jgi:hypothetical protein
LSAVRGALQVATYYLDFPYAILARRPQTHAGLRTKYNPLQRLAYLMLRLPASSLSSLDRQFTNRWNSHHFQPSSADLIRPAFGTFD